MMRGGDLDGDGYDDIVFSSDEPVSGMTDAGGVYAYSGLDGHLLWRVQGTEVDASLGTTGLACTGDLSGDGVPDVLAYEGGNSYPAGAVLVLSGKDGSLIRVFPGEQTGDSFGASVDSLGDIDHDGVSDLVAGAVGFNGNAGVNCGKIYVLSGSSGGLIYSYEGESPGEFFGEMVINAGDIDGDGVSDFATGVRAADPLGNQSAGSVFVYSGASGQLLYRFDGEHRDDELGVFLCRVPDTDNDARGELLVGAWGDDTTGTNAGAAFLFSGANGTVIRTHYGNQPQQQLPRQLGMISDVDGDGTADYFLGDVDIPLLQTYAAVFSGATGNQIGLIPNPEPYVAAFPGNGCGLGDINGDGLGDVAMGSDTFAPNGVTDAGSVFIYIANSLKAPNKVVIGTNLTLDMLAPKQAGKPFIDILSLGNSGLPLGKRRLPLSADPLFFLSLRLPALRGILDMSGRGSLSLPIPFDPSIDGIVLYGCFITLDPAALFGIPMISNGVAITIAAS
jgi:hypothetical protein